MTEQSEPPEPTDVPALIRSAVTWLELAYTESEPGRFNIELPGTNKQKTDCALVVGNRILEVRAFVARNPDENHAAVYRWLLQQNLKLYGISFSVDRLGDIYLTGRIALEVVTEAEIDRLLGAVAQTADESFNPILELGFATAIRREWKWRLDRGESTRNLDAFRHLADPADLAAAQERAGQERPAGGGA
ncbi:YbjN domain-containing protein [Granulicoccus phenolivorans]|uniref:YbjN domain-containing protein n=1 Tax=Granulicoccus phenolivorans TaxID=266854 RepID=UPI00041C71F9|nr:YbjN domain-containing protein [Granulicoccus phenolivorans]